MRQLPIASVSLDLDDEWTYLKIHGDPTWETFPSYLPVVVPRVLEFFARRSLQITFFIVGQDAAFERNREVLSSIARAGHEVGNHSFHHEPWLHRYSGDEIEDEIARAETCIELATGKRPRGFRGPGFSFSPALLQTLARRGYRYDASTFPTFIGPLARAYYFAKSDLPKEELARRASLFGSFSDGLRPNRPYRWRLAEGELLEIPVTTMPGIRAPIHVSYLLYLASFSHALALQYFSTALSLCAMTSTQPSLLLHPLDFLGCEDNSSLAFLPGMSMRRSAKLALLADVIDMLARRHEIVTMMRHAELVLASAKTASRGVEHARAPHNPVQGAPAPVGK